MLDHLSWEQAQDGQDMVVGEKAKLMAGNYRVEALKKRLRLLGCGKEERWWICDIYNKATLSSSDNTLFQGPKTEVERQMLEHLGLSGRVKFPVRRLGTLWRNQNWKQMITRWCEFLLGQATFNISTFEWMASCRIDDFWFTTFHSVINSISQIRSEFSIDVQSSDWIQLASLPQQNLFLTAGDDVYDNLGFADVHSLLKTTKQEGKVMSIVMSHVCQWLNRDPARVGERDNNKPLLRKDFLPALREKCGDDAEKQSIKLQERLLGYVRDKMSDFTSPGMEHYLHEYPDNARDAYAKRFEHQAWRDMLILVVDSTLRILGR
ncbi:uncharacterized protein BDR25DRAFT_352496 [Lindgomyces ingoldianus]|uniref:Uncharacterized protein n=1 Tax=Lindgomyces ingoldianus TaxID=673940 RepID=A0ACB6R407_9PLEO|nr:uncharacterized protein BDR25DRAFT_352496 [Lindgomyces ingoldianus]KAF2474018.1 hypothetical protein BDR25DRAFT_352496 [Lindgomyces ingoldianus]